MRRGSASPSSMTSGGVRTAANTTRERSDEHPRKDTGMTDPTRYAVEHPDEAGDPDGKGTLSRDQAVIIDEAHAPAPDFEVVKDEKTGIYEAIIGGRVVAGMTYNVAGDSRLVLLATSVFPEFRKHGIATELIRRVLDDVRSQGKTVTVMCPIVRTFIEHNPAYADLI